MARLPTSNTSTNPNGRAIRRVGSSDTETRNHDCSKNSCQANRRLTRLSAVTQMVSRVRAHMAPNERTVPSHASVTVSTAWLTDSRVATGRGLRGSSVGSRGGGVSPSGTGPPASGLGLLVTATSAPLAGTCHWSLLSP